MVDGVPISPRFERLTSHICTMPANPAAGVPVEQDSAAVTLSPNANLPDWITICPGGLRGMQYFLSQVKIDGIDSFRGQNLRNIIFNIPERLLLHEFSRGYNASGSFQTGKFGKVFLLQTVVVSQD
jgi:hypothetical protein